MAVGKGSINRVSKAVDDKVTTSVEVKKETPAKAAPVKKTTTVKKPVAKKTTRKTTSSTVSKPSAQVEKVIGKKDVHYGVGSVLPTYLM